MVTGTSPESPQPAPAGCRRLPFTARRVVVAIAAVVLIVVACGGPPPAPEIQTVVVTPEAVVASPTALPSPDAVATQVAVLQAAAATATAAVPATSTLAPTSTIAPTSTLAPTLTAPPAASDTPTAAPPATDTPVPAKPTGVPTKRPTATPQISYPPPTLLAPLEQDAGSLSGPVVFRWSYPRPLQPNEAFQVLIWKEGNPHWGAAELTTETQQTVDLEAVLPQRGGPGPYFWTVVVREKGTEKLLSPEATPWRLTYSPPCAYCNCQSDCRSGNCESCCDRCCGGCQ